MNVFEIFFFYHKKERKQNDLKKKKKIGCKVKNFFFELKGK